MYNLFLIDNFYKKWNYRFSKIGSKFSITLCVCVCVFIYIYCHPQTDYFIVSQLFSVARHTGCFKLGLKPTQLYVRPIIYHSAIGNLMPAWEFKAFCKNFCFLLKAYQVSISLQLMLLIEIKINKITWQKI